MEESYNSPPTVIEAHPFQLLEEVTLEIVPIKGLSPSYREWQINTQRQQIKVFSGHKDFS